MKSNIPFIELDAASKGNCSTAIGMRSLLDGYTGRNSLAIGETALGGYFLGNDTTIGSGNDSISIGRPAGEVTKDENGNTINVGYGMHTLSETTTGCGSIALGQLALRGDIKDENLNIEIGTSPFGKLAEHNTCIGIFAGLNIINQHHCIIIGEFTQEDAITQVTESNTVVVKDNFPYFKTEKGASLYEFLKPYIGTQSNEVIEMLQREIDINWLNDMNIYFKLRNHQ